MTYPFKQLSEWYTFALVVQTQIDDGVALGIPTDMANTAVNAASVFESAYLRAREPATRTAPIVADRQQKLEAFKVAVRPVISFIQAGNYSDEQKRRLMLKIYDTHPTPAPRPTAQPMVELTLLNPTSLRVLVRDPSDPDRRSKPAGVRSIMVMLHRNAGQTPPANPNAWQLFGQEGRTSFEASFPDLARPETIWMRAAYVSTRNETGPLGEAAHIVLPGTGLAVDEQAVTPTMKLAA
jgi:hypothetical protein